MTNVKRLFAVAGNPVLHSKSPDMFRAAFRACSLDALYLRFAFSETAEIVNTAKSMGISGINITSPGKEVILPFLDDIDEKARKTGAVNTVILHNGRLKGYNTDIDGVREALLARNTVLREKRAVVLGAGGAAKAAVIALTSGGSLVTLINRTFSKAAAIARILPCRAAPVEAIAEEVENADILVSCINESSHMVPSGSLKKNLIVLDALYREETPLARDAKQQGSIVIDGREWLLFQGAAAFNRFTGCEPPLEAMRDALYANQAHTRRNIALVGFMGSGKSTVSKYLSEKTGMTLVDIDELIMEKTGSSIETIFENQGEEAFRTMEEREIKNTGAMEGTIISCGGGAVMDSSSMDHLRKNAVVIWLNADIETIMERVGNDSSRPLLNMPDRKTEVEKMLRLRKNDYAYASDFFLNTDEKKPEDIAQRIYNEINTSLGS